MIDYSIYDQIKNLDEDELYIEIYKFSNFYRFVKIFFIHFIYFNWKSLKTVFKWVIMWHAYVTHLLVRQHVGESGWCHMACWWFLRVCFLIHTRWYDHWLLVFWISDSMYSIAFNVLIKILEGLSTLNSNNFFLSSQIKILNRRFNRSMIMQILLEDGHLDSFKNSFKWTL